MTWQKASSLILLVAFPAQAGLKFIPQWDLVGDKACYDAPRAKKLLELDDDLQELADYRELLPGLKADHIKEISELNGQIAAVTDKVVELESQKKDLAKQLRDAETARIKAENNPVGAAGWMVAAGLLLAGAGVALGLSLAPKK